MDDWVDEKESLVSVSEEGKMEMENPSNGDEQAISTGTSIISTGSEKEKMAEGNGEENGESGTGSTGIIDSIASMIPGHSSDGGGEHKADDSASMSNGGEKDNVAEGSGERQDQNGEQITGAGTGIIDSIASKFGVTVSGHSTKEEEQEEGEHKDKDTGGGTIHQPNSSPPDSHPVSEDDVPTADEAILLISIIED